MTEGGQEQALEEERVVDVGRGHPDNHASEKILKKLGFEFIENSFTSPPA
jgi:hypothetical protein